MTIHLDKATLVESGYRGSERNAALISRVEEDDYLATFVSALLKFLNGADDKKESRNVKTALDDLISDFLKSFAETASIRSNQSSCRFGSDVGFMIEAPSIPFDTPLCALNHKDLGRPVHSGLRPQIF